MKRELAILETETRAAINDAQMLFASLTPEETVARPRPGAWSPSECLDHLTLTAEAFLPLIDVQISRSTRYSDKSYIPGWLGRWFLRQIDVPERARKSAFRAPPQFVPRTSRSGSESLAAFVLAHEALLSRIPHLALLDLRRIRVRSPFAARMTYPLGLVCYLIPAHCRRHLAQARKSYSESVATSGS